MEIVTFQAALASAKTAGEILLGLGKLKLDTEVVGRINEAYHEVATVQMQLLNANQQLFELRREKDELLQTIKTYDDWEATKAKFRIVTTAGGATVYESVGEPQNYLACPSCFAKKIVIPLQGLAGWNFRECPDCKTTYSMRP